MKITSIDQPTAPAYTMPERFRLDIAYFMTPGGERGAPKLPTGEYWIDPDDARRWIDAGAIEVVSPLDSLNHTEIELTEEQEGWLRWLNEHGIRHVRVGEGN